jgi:hypothetical protein
MSSQPLYMGCPDFAVFRDVRAVFRDVRAVFRDVRASVSNIFAPLARAKTIVNSIHSGVTRLVCTFSRPTRATFGQLWATNGQLLGN